MSNERLIKVSIMMFMRETITANPPQALDVLKKQFEKIKDQKPDTIDSIYMKALVEAQPTDQEFAEVRASIAEMMHFWAIFDLREIYDGLQNLKFTQAEIFSKLIHESKAMLSVIKNNWDHVLEFYRNVSEHMRVDRITLDEAFQKELAAKRLAYTAGITYYDAIYFLSEEARRQFYVHARVRLILGRDNYRGGPDAETIDKIARYQIVHNNKLYLETDYGLNKLGFSPAECLNLLEQNSDQAAISELHRKISLMPTVLKQIDDLVLGPRKLTLAQAKAETINSTAELSADDFDLLLSPKNKLRLEPILASSSSTADTKPGSTSVLSNAMSTTAKFVNDALSSVTMENLGTLAATQAAKEIVETIAKNTTRAALPGNVLAMANTYQVQVKASNSNDLNALFWAGIGVTSTFLLLLAYRCEPRIIQTPVSVVKNAGAKIMGVFCQQKQVTEDPENDASHFEAMRKFL
ncbi:MAG: hypothetical protein V4501_05195 [Pseudomonadota bacterium]